MSKITKQELFEQLACVKKMVDWGYALAAIRFSLDNAMGHFLFGKGTLVTNYGSFKAEFRGQVERSVKAQFVIDNFKKEIAKKMLTIEHVVPIADLREMLAAGDFEAVVKHYRVIFITKDEDRALKVAKTEFGARHFERYQVAKIQLIKQES